MEEKEVKKEKEIYEKWWFWCIIVFIILIILVSEIFESNEIQQISENNQINDNTTTSENKIETNPYISTQDCNGTYSFSLSSDNGSGYMFSGIPHFRFSKPIRESRAHCGRQPDQPAQCRPRKSDPAAP